MNDLLKLILRIEIRPGLWIGNTDIDCLGHFLSGYCTAKSENEEGYGVWLFQDFTRYLAKKYEDTRTFNWVGLIRENEIDGKSTDAFFRLLHEYLENHTV